LVLETDPVATHVDVTDERLTVYLADGRVIGVPLSWFPRLMHGSPEERASWRLLAKAMPWNGPRWTSTGASKACWRGGEAERATTAFAAGSEREAEHERTSAGARAPADLRFRSARRRGRGVLRPALSCFLAFSRRTIVAVEAAMVV
jgi:hypothetical protein